MSRPYLRHSHGCIAEQAWDILEAQDRCSCTFPYPFRVCGECHNRLHQHRKDCSHRPENAPRPGDFGSEDVKCS